MIRGEFQEVCQSSKDYPYWAQLQIFDESISEEIRWKRCQHCNCEVCEKQRNKLNLSQCTKEKRCAACLSRNKKE